MAEINFQKIERKWQKQWEEAKLFVVTDKSTKPKYYVLEMFPYPSGDGLHMGHALNYVIGDVLARFKIMNGFNVLHPMGYDALGLPAENAAIKVGINPQEYTNRAVKNYIKQQKSLGITYDWSRVVNTADPKFYRWDQWIFLKMLEKGLAYQKESAVNFCSECNTVLANEQVQDGKCWRHENTNVEIKHLKQWFLKISDYADELYESIDGLDGWPSKTKAMQKNWIGKSHGTEIDFKIGSEKWPVFTTRPDTIFGVTFMVISAQHKKLMDIVTDDRREEVEDFLKKLSSVSEKDLGDLEKEGVFTGTYAVNPANNEKVPVYAGNFVVADYGSGMVMAVPAHDQRDFLFAKKYGIEIKQVIAPCRIDKKNPPIKGKKIKARETIHAIVKNKEKVLCMKWKNFPWTTFVVCGVDDGEDVIDAARREVLEETGYKNLTVEKIIETKVRSEYFAAHKDENRVAYTTAIIFNLDNDEQDDIAQEELDKHEALWLDVKSINGENFTCSELDIWMKAINEEGARAYTEDGCLIESGKFDDLNNREAIDKIADFLIKKKLGRKVVNFRLRDWGVSRQRYWGTPIPVIHCDKCGSVPVPEKDLPVKLPKDVKFGEGNPLETNLEWINTKCPKCGGDGRRETDTMDTFVNSSWYFLRYCDPNNDKKIFDSKKANLWCPIDQYVGGAEHACMHLIYFRFYTKFLADIGLINFREPAKKLFHQGMLHGEGGTKMSKSKGNVVNPETVSEKYGIDTARYFLLSLAEPDKKRDWSETGIMGSLRFVNKIFDTFDNITIGESSEKIEVLLNKIIKGINEDIESFRYRMATIKLKQLFDSISEEKEVSKDTLEKALKLLNPICPHITEELWNKLGNDGFISVSEWPKIDLTKLNNKKEMIDLNDKIIDSVNDIISKVEGKENVFVYVMPFELAKIDSKKIGEELGKKVEVYSVSDKKKYDPQNKAKNAKPGMASVFVE